MADDGRDRRKRKKPGVPEWKETCIGVWSRSAKGENVDDNISGRICNGISIVRINKVRLQLLNEVHVKRLESRFNCVYYPDHC